MGKTSIEWTTTVLEDGTVIPGQTWNPARGCVKVSEGCRFCYAERFAERFRGVKGHPYEQGFDPRLVPKKLNDLFKPGGVESKYPAGTKVFVNSMSDLFFAEFPDDYIDSVLGVAALCPDITFQVLTKRARRMREYFELEYRWALIEGSAERIYHERTGEDPSMWLAVHELPNVWFGVSVENQHWADIRIPELVATPGISTRFISAEPLLRSIDFRQWVVHAPEMQLGRCQVCDRPQLDAIHIAPSGGGGSPLDLVIVGGESGPGKRPMELDWARDIRDQCAEASVPFFMKQIDKKTPIPDDLLVRQFPEGVTK